MDVPHDEQHGNIFSQSRPGNRNVNRSASSNSVKYKANELRDIRQKLQNNINPSLLSAKTGYHGEQEIYLEKWKLINGANEVFGFNGWSHSVALQTVDYFHEHEGLFDCGICAIVKVELKDGTYHEDLGYGYSENSLSRGEAYEKARKNAATDGLMQAFRHFGPAVGNCLDDPEHIGVVLSFWKIVPFSVPGVVQRENDKTVTVVFNKSNVTEQSTVSTKLCHTISTQTAETVFQKPDSMLLKRLRTCESGMQTEPKTKEAKMSETSTLDRNSVNGSILPVTNTIVSCDNSVTTELPVNYFCNVTSNSVTKPRNKTINFVTSDNLPLSSPSKSNAGEHKAIPNHIQVAGTSLKERCRLKKEEYHKKHQQNLLSQGCFSSSPEIIIKTEPPDNLTE